MLPGCVRLDLARKVRHVHEHELEFTTAASGTFSAATAGA
jgi:hypothetical protein